MSEATPSDITLLTGQQIEALVEKAPIGWNELAIAPDTATNVLMFMRGYSHVKTQEDDRYATTYIQTGKRIREIDAKNRKQAAKDK